MNSLLFKRSLCLALIMFMMSFANVSFAQTKTKDYDTKQLIRDVAVLYRKHKLADVSPADQLKLNETVARKYIKAKNRVEKVKGFYNHLAIYIIINQKSNDNKNGTS